jgi:molybdopterin-binding protein
LLKQRDCPLLECNQFRGRIASILPGINNNRLVVDCGSWRIAVLMDRQKLAGASYQEGNEIIVGIGPAAIHLIPLSGAGEA